MLQIALYQEIHKSNAGVELHESLCALMWQPIQNHAVSESF